MREKKSGMRSYQVCVKIGIKLLVIQICQAVQGLTESYNYCSAKLLRYARDLSGYKKVDKLGPYKNSSEKGFLQCSPLNGSSLLSSLAVLFGRYITNVL